MANRDIEARLKISAIDRTGSILSTIGAKVEKLATRVTKLNNGVEAATDTMPNAVMTRMAAADRMASNAVKSVATIGTIYAGAQVFKDYAAWDRHMTRIANNANATTEEMKAANDQVYGLSKQLALSPEDLADAVDTLVAGGKSIKDVLELLPSIAKAAQAAGSPVEAMADTTLKLTSAMDIANSQLGKSFDQMYAQGKAGQFEMKDMAAQIPAVANAYARLGDKGPAGLARLVAILQTVRETTATSGEAATDANDLFIKMTSPRAYKKFRKMGVDLEKDLNDAAKNGLYPIDVLVADLQKATKGDVKLISHLFEEQQAAAAAAALMTRQKSYKGYLATATDKDVAGTVDRDLKRITNDAQSSIDRIMGSLQHVGQSMASVFDKPVTSGLDSISEDFDQATAVQRGLQKQGLSGGALWWRYLNLLPVGPGAEPSDEYKRMAREGDYVPANDAFLKRLRDTVPDAYRVLGRYPSRPITKQRAVPDYALSGFTHDQDSMFARHRALMAADELARIQAARDDDNRRRPTQTLGEALKMDMPYGGTLNFHLFGERFRPGRNASTFPARPETVWNNEKRMSDLQFGRDDGFAAMAKQIEANNAALNEGGEKIKDGGDQAGKALVSGAEQASRLLIDAVSKISAIISGIKIPSASPAAQVNANTGKNNTFVRPATLGPQ